MPYEEPIFLDPFYSENFVNWEKHDRIIDTAEVKWVKGALWVPSIIKKYDDYFLFFGVVITHEG